MFKLESIDMDSKVKDLVPMKEYVITRDIYSSSQLSSIIKCGSIITFRKLIKQQDEFEYDLPKTEEDKGEFYVEQFTFNTNLIESLWLEIEDFDYLREELQAIGLYYNSNEDTNIDEEMFIGDITINQLSTLCSLIQTCIIAQSEEDEQDFIKTFYQSNTESLLQVDGKLTIASFVGIVKEQETHNSNWYISPKYDSVKEFDASDLLTGIDNIILDTGFAGESYTSGNDEIEIIVRKPIIR